LFTEDCYQDITCRNCGASTGKYGDENKCVNLWNGDGLDFYAVIWRGSYGSRLLELWDDRATADANSKKYNDQIFEGKSPLGYKIDLSHGIRETCSVESIESNKPYDIEEDK
jgi:hypothetical protein